MACNLRHTFRRGTTFYYNRRVPKGVDDAFGCSVVRLNLGCDPEKALQLSEALTDKLDELWSSPRVVPVDLNQLHLGLLPQRFDLLSCLDAYLEVRDICEKPVRLAVRALTHVAGSKEITDYTRSEAKQLIQTLTKKGNKSATVRRRLHSLHAVFEFGCHDFQEPCHLAARHIKAFPEQLSHDLAGAVDPPVLHEHTADLVARCSTTADVIRQPCRASPLCQVRIVGGAGKRQHRADRLGPMRITMHFGENHDLIDRRSSSAVEK
jgi:hypothetical protein